MTLRQKVIVAFGLITVPLVAFLLYTNYYSSKVVREQAAGYNAGLLTLYGDQLDQTLETGNSYLYRLANQEPVIRSLVYHAGDLDEYTMTRVAVSSRLYADFQYNPSMYLEFVYNPNNRDLIMAQPNEKSYEEAEGIASYLKGLFEGAGQGDRIAPFELLWQHCSIGGDSFLLRIVQTDTNTYAGALIRLDVLMKPLQLIARDQSIHAYFLSREGAWLTPGPPPDAAAEGSAAIVASASDNGSGKRAYRTVRGAEKYLMVSHPLGLCDLVLAVMIPEKVMLQQVPMFQRIGYVIPFAAGIVLLIFLAYVQNLVIDPMQRLVKGMRQLSKGNLDTRLAAGRSAEFALIGETFNNMASEIQDLKIHVYEEEIRSQKAEIKQLQLQMNPHFLFNSLNIIYNLAETGRVRLIQQMTRHMVEYLRFFARLKEHAITVREELANVEHYMNIQKLRFPRHLAYEWEMEDAAAAAQLPPLTVQPFVENALKHGFSNGRDLFCVTVRARVLDREGRRFIELVIEDNGKGFPAGLTEHLTETLADPAYTKAHIGIWNVYNHLKIQYRGEAELRLSNVEPKGARVVMVIPYRVSSQEGEVQDAQPIDRG
ncbi:HAMP domain-containing protein [Paenibacillus lycopersici]|uniref:HAMP domain-containing protein n=1 Tax=Paenibacillus lycopersici TaxID=2704462 RepID=A0A6C0FV73_9BACL|nr:histidine kinase [Paenibacillus lycopersici]QHT59371.1 HAMP domain-containing protein [Paenibacillus lycopersici]